MKKYGVDVMDNDHRIKIEDNKLIVYSSKDGEGKTSFMLQQALTNIRDNDNMKVLYVSGEDTINEIMPRIINWHKETAVHNSTFEDIKNSEDFIDLMNNFYFVSMSSVNIIDFVTEKDIDMIFIDSPILNPVNNAILQNLRDYEFSKDVNIVLSVNVPFFKNRADDLLDNKTPNNLSVHPAVADIANLIISIEKFTLDKSNIFNPAIVVTVASVLKNKYYSNSKYVFFTDYEILKFSSTF